jgi:uncharacterized membrane protein
MNAPLTGGAPGGPLRPVLAVYIGTAAGTLAWLAAIVLAPWLASGRSTARAAALLYAAFSPICHQIPERCFQFHGHPLAVCGRCLGIYAGFALGLALYPLVRGFSTARLPSARVFILVTLPMAVDGTAGALGLWASPIGLRFASGAVWGILLPFYFVTGAADLLRTRRARREARALENQAGKT